MIIIRKFTILTPHKVKQQKSILQIIIQKKQNNYFAPISERLSKASLSKSHKMNFPTSILPKIKKSRFRQKTQFPATLAASPKKTTIHPQKSTIQPQKPTTHPKKPTIQTKTNNPKK